MEPYTLTKADVKYLRSLERICVRYDKEKGISQLELLVHPVLENYSVEYRHLVPVRTLNIHGGTNLLSAFAFLMTFGYVDTFRFMCEVGDILTVRFFPSNTSKEFTQQTGVSSDMMEFQIHRGAKTLTFLMAVDISTNEFSRMCRVEGE